MAISACPEFFAKFAKFAIFAKFGYPGKLHAKTARKVDSGLQLRRANEHLPAVKQSG
jgi:hypothetical protein